ncbi:3-oxoacyl-ACP reductase FabG [Desulfosediminicola ganghwensis]|uniref:3-oxoacyl-ACP reductase FabG n=1 Tax=Desulfosediminicola ganghwensis TaxID=2569540 RepID=UPI0010AC96A8|nr:3-oxoacyl-ACP reductase FabG [Desulfosediminicola ganghwensis]
MDFTGKTALVTGSGSGIGKTIALQLAARGADIVVNDVSQEHAKATVEEIENLGRSAVLCCANVASRTEVQEMFELAKEKFGKVDIVVNNAGVTRDNFLLKMTDQEWDLVMDVNLKGVFNCCRSAAALMSETGYGKIINISSASGQMGNIGQVNYAASKGGVISITKTLAKELARYNINVNAVAPGFIETPMTETVPDKVKDHLKRQIPLGRAGSPEDIAHAVLFLASDLSSYITGQVVASNGGMYM